MRWRWLGSSAVALGALLGCKAERPAFVHDARDTVADRLATDPNITARLQKPEADKGATQTSFLDAQPPRPADLAADRRAARIWATVNGKPILEEEVRESCHLLLIQAAALPEPLRSVKVKEILQAERDRLIEQELLLQDAYDRLKKAGQQYLDKLKEAAGKQFDRQLRLYKKHYGLQSDEELKKFLTEQGLSLDGIRKQKEREFIASEYLRNLIMPAIDNITPSQVREYYKQHSEEFTVADRVEWQDIFIDASKFPSTEAARKFAEELIARIRAGEDFAALAEQYDNGYSRSLKGAGAGQQRGQISPPEVEPVVFSLAEGEVGPIVELPTGFHVVRVAKREYAGRKPFDEKVQAQILNQLRNEVANRETRRIITKLKEKAILEVPASVP